MHIYFSGIGGTAIGPLAMIAKQAGYSVSGSDKQNSQYIEYLRSHGIDNIQIDQSYDAIQLVNQSHPIDWFVYTSALTIENPDAPELRFCHDNNIRISKRGELINQILSDKNLKMIAVAGTHGKTTTTAMAVWLFKQLDIPISYSVGAKIGFGEMGQYTEGSEYFVYEADEFDRNFLEFEPNISIITGISWDHHEQYPTRADYEQAFAKFVGRSKWRTLWQEDAAKAEVSSDNNSLMLQKSDEKIDKLSLIGQVNRQNAWQVINAVNVITGVPVAELMSHMDKFPGLSRRFEVITNNLYTDYAHTEEKIRGALQTAQETGKSIVVVYEPLTDRRQHFIKDAYKDLFDSVKKLYWVPSYLAREDPSQKPLTPVDLIALVSDKHIAEPAELGSKLRQAIQMHLDEGDLVLCLSGGGGGSLDEWLRHEFSQE